MQQILLQNATAILLQTATKFITKCVMFFITKCDNFISLRQFLENASILLQNPTVVTNCDIYYEMRRCILYRAFLPSRNFCLENDVLHLNR